ncbi:GH25 family lysozyme [Bifidobacterium choloepi]|nr:GH25 family lysozyme [Bifidobacterium choloepi]
MRRRSNRFRNRFRASTIAAIASTLALSLGVAGLPMTAFADDAMTIADGAITGGTIVDGRFIDDDPVVAFEDYIASNVDVSGQEDPQHMWTNAEDEPQAQASSPYWTTTSGNKTFVDGNGNTFASPAMKVIDVSKWQGEIDWAKVKAAGVDAAIIRLGYGNGTEDPRLAENIAGAQKVGMPLGFYLYSYADTAALARTEADWIVTLLKKYNITSWRLPIFYDLEEWGSWDETDRNGKVIATHYQPTTVAGWSTIINAFYGRINQHGYTNTYLYTYRAMANAYFDNAAKAKVSWIAEYNPTTTYTFPGYSGGRGWQYTSSASVNGISGNVDMSAFDEHIFWDANSRSTAHDSSIKWAKNKGVTTGYANGAFGVGNTVIRQDMAAFLYRVAGSPSFTPTAAQRAVFSDVNSSTPHANAIWWMASKGITEGFTDGGYHPTAVVNRQDMAAFLYRIAGSPEYTPTAAIKAKFSDVTDSTPHAKEIWWCASAGIANGWTSGSSTVYRPTASVQRQDMAAFLERVYNVMH